MKALSLQLTAAAAVLVMVFAPSASARSKAHVKLSVLPLPASSIGSAATSLPLQRAGSGVLGDGSGDATTPNGAFGFFGPVFGEGRLDRRLRARLRPRGERGDGRHRGADERRPVQDE